LEEIRSNIGSNFNFIASQFEEVDYLFFTEDNEDFKIVKSIIDEMKIQLKLYNIPINGFQQYPSTIFYKRAYELLMGKSPNSVVLLDRDYYPESFLEEIKQKLQSENLRLILTPGKELENIFISPELFKSLLKDDEYNKFFVWFTGLLEQLKDDTLGDYIGFYLKFVRDGREKTTIIKEYKKSFDSIWNSGTNKNNLVPGKKVLKEIRNFMQLNHGITLTNNVLVKLLHSHSDSSEFSFLEIFSLNN
jgi:hypothetical protein